MSSYAVVKYKIELETVILIVFAFTKIYFLQVGSFSDTVKMIFEVH